MALAQFHKFYQTHYLLLHYDPKGYTFAHMSIPQLRVLFERSETQKF